MVRFSICKLEEGERIGNGIYDKDTERGVQGVKIELIETNDDGTMKVKKVNGVDEPVIAKLYQFKTNNAGGYEFDEFGQHAIVELEAVTYTDENGNYQLIGVIPDEYIVRYTYGDETYIAGEKISSRDYKSTVITSEAVENALNINTEGYPDGLGDFSWHTKIEADANNNIIRYSDAIDDIKQRSEQEDEEINYRTVNSRALEDSTKVNNTISADTATFYSGIEFTKIENKDSESDKYNYNYTNEKGEKVDATGMPLSPYSPYSSYQNGLYLIETLGYIDFGIIKRPEIDITLDKEISDISVVLANGQILLDGDPSDANVQMPYTKTGLDDYVPIEIDSELIQGATLKMTYSITLINNSELDYEYRDGKQAGNLGRIYYYFGKKQPGIIETDSRIELVVDYLDGELAYDKDKINKLKQWNNSNADTTGLTENINDIIDEGWNITAQKLYEEGLISENVKNKLEEKKYTILTTTQFNNVPRGQSKTLEIDVSKLLTTKNKDDMVFYNNTEILQLSGHAGRSILESTPGNLIPEQEKPKNKQEIDEDIVRTIIIPPTGSISKAQLIIIISSSLAILLLGIIVIKKKVLE